MAQVLSAGRTAGPRNGSAAPHDASPRPDARARRSPGTGRRRRPGHPRDLGPGGWIGVDVFFTLSGFLITLVLLREHQATGRIALGAFYRRRAARLLPALLGAT